MAVYTVLDRKTLHSLAATYELGKLRKGTGVAAGSVNTHYLLETSKGFFFLKIDEVKSHDAVRHEIDLLLFLRQHRFPCPEPLTDREGRYCHEHNGKMVSLYPRLPGRAYEESDFTAARLEQAGRTLATLHVIGQEYPQQIDNRFNADRMLTLYQEIREQIPTYEKQLIYTLDNEVAYQQEYQDKTLAQGVIHGDLFADNLLFLRGKVVGMLDFEAACYGKYTYDLATAVNALCYQDGQYNIGRFEALLHGYQSTRILPLIEWDAFPNELRFSALRFTLTRLKDFFLRPMDGVVRVNKDFREFFERLRVLRREQPGGMEKLLPAMAIGYDYRQYQKIQAQEKRAGERKKTGNRAAAGK